jgi:Zn-dependent protease
MARRTAMTGQSALHVVYLAVGLLFGLVVHEYAHAWTATRLGDITPRQYGRLTLNPKPHIDPFGTIFLPGILLLVVLFGGNPFVFAYAKPQPLNPWSLRRQDQHATIIALAGPAANVILAFVFGGLYRLTAGGGGGGGQLRIFLADCLIASVILAAMNLMPIPPLDMSRVVARLLPARARELMTNLEQYGALFMLVIFFIISGPIFTFVRIIGNGICRATAGGPCL